MCIVVFSAISRRVPPQGFDITEGYLDGLLVRLRDKGVSVRKTVVGILRDVLLYQVHTHTALATPLAHTQPHNIFLALLLYQVHTHSFKKPYYAAL